MRGAREQNKRAMQIPRSRGSTVSNDNAARTGGQSPELTGHCLRVSVKKDELSSPRRTVDRILDPPAPLPDAKMKLQLYPVDEGTRIGLEKDGIHPYLELTLRRTKRISSVLKHINSKWGSSKVALGELVLSPYDIHGDISRCRTWTMKDSDTRAGDVYVSIGRPETFRLRYGWVPPPELKTCETSPFNGCLQTDGARKDCSSVVKNLDEDERVDCQSGQSPAPWIDELANASIGALLSETSLQGKLNSDEPGSMENNTDSQLGQTSYSKTMLPLWADSLADISIGGLFSEASLQGKFDNVNTPKSTDSQSHQIFSDSLDAFISARTRCSQGPPRPPSHDSQTFILDGEETCHAFPVPKFSSSGKRVSAIGGSSAGCNQESGSSSFKFPKIDEMSTEAGVSEARPTQDSSQIDIFLSPRTYNDENSLGLANIRWGESLGPFDLGLSASRKLAKEENRHQV